MYSFRLQASRLGGPKDLVWWGLRAFTALSRETRSLGLVASRETQVTTATSCWDRLLLLNLKWYYQALNGSNIQVHEGKKHRS